MTLPLRLITRNWPGAVAAMLGASAALAVVFVELLIEVCVLLSWFGVFVCIDLPVVFLLLF
mgnify:CR=1 FL=1